MKNLFNFFMHDENGLKIQKLGPGDSWSVKKGFRTLYIGTKEKCQIFISQAQAAF